MKITYTAAEVKTIFANPALTPRELALAHLIIGCGLRAAECAKLRVGDVTATAVNVPNSIAKYRRGGTVEMLNPTTRNGLQTYKATRPAGDELPFLPSRNGGFMSVRNVELLWDKITAVLPADRRGSPHAGRRAFASILYQAKVEMLKIQKLLRHENLNTTCIYIQDISGEPMPEVCFY
jgi:integrase